MNKKNNRLSTPIQIEILKKRFVKYNPDIDTQEIDWIGETDDTLSFEENLEGFKYAYPQYQWGEKEDPYVFQAVNSIKEEANNYGLEVVGNGATRRLRNENDELKRRNHDLKLKMVKNGVLVEEPEEKDIPENPKSRFFDAVFADIKQTHIIVNAESGHGKSTSVMTVIQEFKERDPKLIVKVFDVSFAWWERAPLAYRQKITPQKLMEFAQGKPIFTNLNDCVYEMGDLSEEMRRFFVAIIIKQDYGARRAMVEIYGMKAVHDLPRIVYVLEEADTYFDSISLNKKDEASETLRDFIKVGRNFGLRAFCVVTASSGELGTKLRRRSKHLIGKIINESDLHEYNRKVKDMGNLALQLPRFHWLYYNGESVIGPFQIGDEVKTAPKDYVVVKREGDIEIKIGESAPFNPWPWLALVLALVLLAVILIR